MAPSSKTPTAKKPTRKPAKSARRSVPRQKPAVSRRIPSVPQLRRGGTFGSWVLALLLFASVAAMLWVYLPGQFRQGTSSKALPKRFTEGLDNHIGNYLLMDYWEQHNDYHEARRYYGDVSSWLPDDIEFRGRAFLGYLYAGDYARATAFFGTLENIESDTAGRFHSSALDWLGGLSLGGRPYGDWENFFQALQKVTQDDYPAAHTHLERVRDNAFIFRFAVPIVRFFLEPDDVPLSTRWQRYGDLLRSDSRLYISMRTAQAAMRRDWQQIVEDVDDLHSKNQSLPYRAQWLYVYALAQLGQTEKAVEVIDGFAPDYDINKLFLHDLKQNILSETLPALPDRPEYYIVEQFLYLIELLSRSRVGSSDSLLLARLGLYLVPEHAGLSAALGEILTQDDKLPQAIAVREALQTVYDDPDFPLWVRVNNQLSLALLYTDAASEDDSLDDRRGVELLRALQKQYPEIYQFYVQEGHVWLSLEQDKRALKAYDRAFAALPFADYTQWQPAFADLEHIIASDEPSAFLQNPEVRSWQPFWRLFYLRGTIYERLDRLEKAQDDLMFAVAFNPSNAGILNYLGYTLAEQGIHLDHALNLLRRATVLESDNGAIIDSLGWAYYRMGDYEQALPFLELAIELEPDDAVVNDHLGDVYWRLGFQRDARFQWQRALDMEPESDQIGLIEDKLRHGLQ